MEESIRESHRVFQIREVRAHDPFGIMEGASEIENQFNNRSINGDEALMGIAASQQNENHQRNNSLMD